MKNKTIFLVVFITTIYSLSSCKQSNNNSNDMSNILQKCKGHAIVIEKGFKGGFNKGNYNPSHFYLIIVDDSSNRFEYNGREYYVEVGDTLK